MAKTKTKFSQIMICLLMSIFLLESCVNRTNIPIKLENNNAQTSPTHAQQIFPQQLPIVPYSQQIFPQQLPTALYTQPNFPKGAELAPKRRKIEYNRESLGDLKELPEDAFNKALSHIGPKDMNNIRNVCRWFYRYITGFSEPGVKGLVNKPQEITSGFRINNRCIDFSSRENKKLKPAYTLRTPFYHLVGRVEKMPEKFWPYIADSKIEFFKHDDICDDDIPMLFDYLKNSNIRTFFLGCCDFGEGLLALGKRLPHTEITQLCLISTESVSIPIDIAIGLVKNLVVKNGDSEKIISKLHTIRLSNLEGDDANELDKFAKSFEGTNIEVIELSDIYINDKDQATACITGFTNSLNSKVHTIILHNSCLCNVDAASLAKTFQNLHTVDLSFNNLNDEWVKEFAANLPNNVTAVYLYDDDSIREEVLSLLKEKYPNVNWIFFKSIPGISDL